MILWKDRTLGVRSQTVKKLSVSWAFSYVCGTIYLGDARCWNVEKWNEEYLKS